MAFDAEHLKYWAAEAVTKYLNTGTALTDVVSSIAIREKLNLEQMKRLVEVTNQVAYLKLLESAKDRTFKFPLAIYEDVVSKTVTPISKEASEMTSSSPLDIVAKLRETPEMEKAASEQEMEQQLLEKFAMENSEKIIFHLRKQAEELACRDLYLEEELYRQAREVRGDAYLAEKLEKVAGENYAELSVLLTGKVLEKKAMPLFQDKDLEKVAKLAATYREAKEVLASAQALDNQIEKLAFLGPLVSTVAKAPGIALAKGATRSMGGVVGTAAVLGEASQIRSKNSVSQAIHGMSKAAETESTKDLDPYEKSQPGAETIREATELDNILDKEAAANKRLIGGLLGKMIPEGLTPGQRFQRVVTGADLYGQGMIIRPKESVWESLHGGE